MDLVLMSVAYIKRSTFFFRVFRFISIIGLCLLMVSPVAAVTQSENDEWDIYTLCEDDETSEKTRSQQKDGISTAYDADIFDQVLLVQGDVCSGTGVCLKDGTNMYMYTVLSLMYKNKRVRITDINGTRFTPRSMEYARDREIVRIRLSSSNRKGLQCVSHIDMSSWGTVYGNEDDKKVIKLSDARVTGIGKEMLNIQSELHQKCNGAPIINDNKEVLGIILYRSFFSTNMAASSPIFAGNQDVIRIDTITDWEDVHPRYFTQEAAVLNAREKALCDATTVLKLCWRQKFDSVIAEEPALPEELNRWITEHNNLIKGMDSYVKYADLTTRQRRRLLDNYNSLIYTLKGHLKYTEKAWHTTHFENKWKYLDSVEKKLWTYIYHKKDTLTADLDL